GGSCDSRSRGRAGCESGLRLTCESGKSRISVALQRGVRGPRLRSVLPPRLGFWVDLDQLEGLLTVSTVEAAVAAKELRRWMAWLGGPPRPPFVFPRSRPLG